MDEETRAKLMWTANTVIKLLKETPSMPCSDVTIKLGGETADVNAACDWLAEYLSDQEPKYVLARVDPVDGSGTYVYFNPQPVMVA